VLDSPCFQHYSITSESVEKTVPFFRWSRQLGRNNPSPQVRRLLYSLTMISKNSPVYLGKSNRLFKIKFEVAF